MAVVRGPSGMLFSQSSHKTGPHARPVYQKQKPFAPCGVVPHNGAKGLRCGGRRFPNRDCSAKRLAPPFRKPGSRRSRWETAWGGLSEVWKWSWGGVSGLVPRSAFGHPGVNIPVTILAGRELQHLVKTRLASTGPRQLALFERLSSAGSHGSKDINGSGTVKVVHRHNRSSDGVQSTQVASALRIGNFDIFSAFICQTPNLGPSAMVRA